MSESISNYTIKAGAYLSGVNLYKANLKGTNLYRANLTYANVQGANLSNANLTGANLEGADLSNANLEGANLQGANLSNAELSGANLTGANLAYADLTNANLENTNLENADLAAVWTDIDNVLSMSPDEVPALLLALREGRVDGSTYVGPCACLIGTLAQARGRHYSDIPHLRPYAERAAERWFLGISKGDTPATKPVSRLTAEYVERWLLAR